MRHAASQYRGTKVIRWRVIVISVHIVKLLEEAESKKPPRNEEARLDETVAGAVYRVDGGIYGRDSQPDWRVGSRRQFRRQQPCEWRLRLLPSARRGTVDGHLFGW